jgi:uncharacterized Fe-S radical SAM superfamily protein PflX
MNSGDTTREAPVQSRLKFGLKMTYFSRETAINRLMVDLKRKVVSNFMLCHIHCRVKKEKSERGQSRKRKRVKRNHDERERVKSKDSK